MLRQFRDSEAKVFCFFFSKKKFFLNFLQQLPATPATRLLLRFVLPR